MRRYFFILTLMLLVVPQTPIAFAVTAINGKVTAKRGDSVKVQFQPHKIVGPKIGDKVEFSTEIEGLKGIKVGAGTGKVTKVDGEAVWVKTSDNRPKPKMNAIIQATGSAERVQSKKTAPGEDFFDKFFGQNLDKNSEQNKVKQQTPKVNLFAQGLLVKELRGSVQEVSRSGNMPRGLSEKQKKARVLATGALVEEIRRSSDPSDPVPLRTSWDESFGLGKGDVDKDEVNAQRRSILLETFDLNPYGLAKQIETMGLRKVDDLDKAYDAFFNGIKSRRDLVRQGSEIKSNLRPYGGRIVAAYKMLPEGDQEELAKEYEPYEEAWFQVRMKLNHLENPPSGLTRNDANKKNAMEAMAELDKLIEAAELLAKAAAERLKK